MDMDVFSIPFIFSPKNPAFASAIIRNDFDSEVTNGTVETQLPPDITETDPDDIEGTLLDPESHQNQNLRLLQLLQNADTWMLLTISLSLFALPVLLRWALIRIIRRTLYNKINDKGAKTISKKCKKMQDKLNIKQLSDKGCQTDIIIDLDHPLCSNSQYENLCDHHDLKYSGKWTDDIMEEWWFNKQAYPCMYEGIRSQLEQANDDRRKRRMQLEQEMERFGFEEENRELYRKVLSKKDSDYIRLCYYHLSL